MKMFSREHQENKHWCIMLEKSITASVNLCAVNESTGEHITVLIVFDSRGEIGSCRHAEQDLKAGGYDPYEHYNQFDDEGRIVIATCHE